VPPFPAIVSIALPSLVLLPGELIFAVEWMGIANVAQPC